MHPESYKTFKALGILLCYPNEKWLNGVDDLCGLIEQERLLKQEDAIALRSFAEALRTEDIFEAQENYVDTFDRVRSLSLHLFEHVHGESRDRGQAMVDLTELYKEQGFTLGISELPDYLPIFLEYLSYLPKAEALELLSDPVNILLALGKRLAERGSPYHVIFDSLVRLVGRAPEKVERRIAPEEPSFALLDKEWEDKPIDFMGAEAPTEKVAGGCGGGGCSSGGCGGKAAKSLEEMTQGVRP